MTEWNKREEEHVSALEEAEAVLRTIRRLTGKGIAYTPALTLLEIDKLCYEWMRRWIDHAPKTQN